MIQREGAEGTVELDLLQRGADEIDHRRQDEHEQHDDQPEHDRRESRQARRAARHGKSLNIGMDVPSRSSNVTCTRASQRTLSGGVPTMLDSSRTPSSNSTIATT